MFDFPDNDERRLDINYWHNLIPYNATDDIANNLMHTMYNFFTVGHREANRLAMLSSKDGDAWQLSQKQDVIGVNDVKNAMTF